MLFPSIFFFLYYGAASVLLPYLALFYQSRGMSGAQIGLLAAIPPIISFFGASLWTGAADVTRRHKLITVLTILAVIVIAVIFPQMTTFGGLLLMICLYALFGSPIGSLVDSAVMAELGDKGENYGRIRLWGTIGYGIIAPFAGSLIGRLGLQWSFWGYAILLLAGLAVIFPMHFRQSHSNGSFQGNLKVLLANQPWVLFLVMVFIAGIGMATINTYIFVYMQSLGASKLMMGFALTASTISEIQPCFSATAWFADSGRGMLVIAMTTIGLRLICYALTTQAWMVLIIQLSHGLTYATIYTAGVYFADQVAPAGLKSTSQGMFTGTLMGFGSAAGGFLGGVLLDRFSPGGMYAVIGTLVLVGLMLFLVIEWRFFAMKGKSHGTI